MSAKASPDKISAVLALRAQGYSLARIVMETGVCRKTAGQIINGTHCTTHFVIGNIQKDESFVDQWRKPPVRAVVNRAAIRQIIAEGRGDIPREELMARP